jgi:hypothetical protein
MASEKDANLAREQHSDLLRSLGAHAIAVDQVKRKAGKTFAVVAYFASKPRAVPKKLEVRRGKATLQVPLIARVQEKFQLE